MTNAELNAKLVELHATLPAHLRETLDLAKARRRARTGAGKGKRPGRALAAARRAPRKDKLALYAESPWQQIVNTLLQLFLERANQALPTAFREVPINLFGVASNRLDPLQFNGQAEASTSGSVCIPGGCTDFVIRWCNPPICGEGGASAGLQQLHGLSSVHLGKIEVRGFMGPTNGVVKVATRFEISFGSLNATAFARAYGGAIGIKIPVGIGASAGIANVSAKCKVVFTVNFKQPAITAIQLTELRLSHGAISINIHGVPGAFNFVVGPLTTQLKNFVQSFVDVDGKISKAVEGVLRSQLSNLLG